LESAIERNEWIKLKIQLKRFYFIKSRNLKCKWVNNKC